MKRPWRNVQKKWTLLEKENKGTVTSLSRGGSSNGKVGWGEGLLVCPSGPDGQNVLSLQKLVCQFVLHWHPTFCKSLLISRKGSLDSRRKCAAGFCNKNSHWKEDSERCLQEFAVGVDC